MFEEFHYDGETGKLYRNGKEAGWKHNAGYRCVSYRDKKYLVHRVIWYMHYGVWPTYHIDHINQDPSDNRLENLRDVPASVNIRNQRKIKGYHYHKACKKWCAQISVNNKTVYLGLYETEEEAMKTYQNAKKSIDSAAGGQ